MTKKKENCKSFYQKGDAGFWSSYGNKDEFTREEEGEDGTIYRANFRYENISSRIELDAKYDADYGDWKDYIEECERAKKIIDSQNISGQDKKREKDAINNQSVDLNQGTYNQLFNQIKAIDLNIQRTIPEKMKDMRAIMQQVESKNRAITAAHDKKLDKLQEENINLTKELKKALEDGNKGLVAKINYQMKEVEGKIAKIADEKSKYADNGWIKDFLEGQEVERNKWFWEKIDWQEPRTYGILSVWFLLLISVVLLVFWAINKLKSLIRENQ